MVTSFWWHRTLVSLMITIFKNCMKVIPEMCRVHYLKYLSTFLCIYQMYTLFWQSTQLPIFSMFKAYMYLFCLLLYYYHTITKMNRRYIVLTYIFTKAVTLVIFLFIFNYEEHILWCLFWSVGIYIIRKNSGEVNWLMLKLQLNNCPLLV